MLRLLGTEYSIWITATVEFPGSRRDVDIPDISQADDWRLYVHGTSPRNSQCIYRYKIQTCNGGSAPSNHNQRSYRRKTQLAIHVADGYFFPSRYTLFRPYYTLYRKRASGLFYGSLFSVTSQKNWLITSRFEDVSEYQIYSEWDATERAGKKKLSQYPSIERNYLPFCISSINSLKAHD